MKSVPIKLIKLRKTSEGRVGRKKEQTTKVIIIIKIIQNVREKKEENKIIIQRYKHLYWRCCFMYRRSFTSRVIFM